ncbi:MAG: transglutaminase family protein [Bacillota bacterium]|nr:transglutaminase family protein [Bacillota bacterium]
MNLEAFIKEDKYINFSSPNIREKANELFKNLSSDIEKAKAAYEFVRDEIPHSFDINAMIITAKASDVLKYKTGICHAKANLLAALLRSQGIPTGMCFQHITLADDESLGYCVHCYNAIYLNGQWIKVDARGNTKGINAQFSLSEPKLAFPNRENYDEYFWKGIYAAPHKDTMDMLEAAKTIQDIYDNIPDYVTEKPDIE